MMGPVDLVGPESLINELCWRKYNTLNGIWLNLRICIQFTVWNKLPKSLPTSLCLSLTGKRLPKGGENFYLLREWDEGGLKGPFQ